MLFPWQKQHRTDEELMLAWTKQRSSSAFEELYKRYGKRMHYFFYRMLWQDSDKADDFLHDLFLKVIEKPHLFQSGKVFSVWLYAMASNMCKNEYRSRGYRQEISLEATHEAHWLEQEGMSQAFDKRLLAEEITRQLDKMGEDQKLLLVLKYQEELSNAEIASILQIPEGTVKSRLFYLIQKLAPSFQPFHPRT